MLTSLDSAAVRHFTSQLEAQSQQCDNGEGMVCETLDQSIDFYLTLCRNLREGINQWARAVFTGQLAFDAETEALWMQEVQALLGRAKRLAWRGHRMNFECFEFRGLGELNYHIVDLDYLLGNWVSPQQAVAPGSRVKIPEGAQGEIRDRLENLPPLPSDWRPFNPLQDACFQKLKNK
jgi:hypothetical protein